MKIRSITYFDDLKWMPNSHRLDQARKFISAARKAYQDGGFEVQTTRLATPPFPNILREQTNSDALPYAKALEEELTDDGFDFVSIGPAIPEYPASYTLIPEILKNTHNIFVAGVMSSAKQGIVMEAIKACAAVVKQVAEITPDGFANLRFAALANVPPGAPFLPAAYHDEHDKPAFAIATEAADLAVSAIGEATSLEDARGKLIDNIETQAGRLTSLGISLAESHGLQFTGIDFTLAPYPQFEQSIGTAIERLGVQKFGEHGSLAAVAILADALDQAHYPKVGFNGVMLPLLEDILLAKRAVEGSLGIIDLLLYSTVCGTGLDTIPLPGDISEEQLFALLLDLAVLAQRLDKPLTARLMPIPGKRVGNPTEFEFEYFANSRVMDLKAQPLSGLLAGDETYRLKSKTSSQGDI